MFCRDCVKENRYVKANPKSRRALALALQDQPSGEYGSCGELLLDAVWRGHTNWGEVAVVGQRWRLGLWALRPEEQVLDTLGTTTEETC